MASIYHSNWNDAKEPQKPGRGGRRQNTKLVKESNYERGEKYERKLKFQAILFHESREAAVQTKRRRESRAKEKQIPTDSSREGFPFRNQTCHWITINDNIFTPNDICLPFRRNNDLMYSDYARYKRIHTWSKSVCLLHVVGIRVVISDWCMWRPKLSVKSPVSFTFSDFPCLSTRARDMKKDG